ncbi:MAG TPA: type IX secretion system membrane protein PorP/SprF [Saprospiraceae bacterium]|nr:type IX secretion system membrane protein PorP/SprF [Saprospiraceae bacterium]
MQRQTIFILFVAFIWSFSAKGQDPIYSQYYAAPLQLNPAFTGNTYTPHIAINYRNQWPSLSQAYVTYSVSYSQFFKKFNSGIGLMILADDAGQGLYKTNKVGGFYSYRLEMNNNLFLKLGVEASFVRISLGWDKLLFRDQIDPDMVSGGGTPFPTQEVRPESIENTYFDASAGLLLYSPHFYAGITTKHLNTPNESFLKINENLDSGLPLRLGIHAGYEFKIREGNKRKPASFISPNVMFVKQGDFGQLNIGAYGNLGIIFGGVWYRQGFANPDAAIVLLGVQKGGYKIGYSYDITVSRLTLGRSGGSHEISLIMNFDKPHKVDYNDCFGLFR